MLYVLGNGTFLQGSQLIVGAQVQVVGGWFSFTLHVPAPMDRLFFDDVCRRSSNSRGLFLRALNAECKQVIKSLACHGIKGRKTERTFPEQRMMEDWTRS